MLPASETVIWLVRHGRSTFNVLGRCQGCCDLPELTAAGRQAARQTGARLRRAGIEVLISSPMRRGLQTAFAIAEELAGDIPLELDARLREIELPQWEGLPLAEIPRRFPEQFLNWQLRPCQLSMAPPCGERIFPVRGLYQRAREFWRDLLAAYTGRSVALVTHAGTGRALITTALGLSAEHFQSIQQSNCAVSRLRFSPAGHEAQLELLNDTAHLGEQLPKLKESNSGTRLLLIPAVDEGTAELHQITTSLESLPVEAVFAAGTDGVRTASRILPRNLREGIQCIPEESLYSCATEALDHGNRHSILHVLFVAPTVCLRPWLQQQFSLTPLVADRMILTGSAMTAVHYPGVGEPPVLQSLNMFEPEFSLAGASL